MLLPLLVNGKPGNEGMKIDQAVRRSLQGRPPQWQPRGKGPRLPYRSPLRTELITALKSEEMLPAIVFIFSRAACDEAVRQVVRDGVRLTDGSERATIREIAERRVESLSDEDLGVLGYDDWLEGLEAGVASHHAGLVPVFRETVEECFAAGLLQVVFATETLSLGINMPARSVVIERFTKYGGAGRATLTSGEYLQLTGRAGRRGLDEEGHAVALWSSETAFSEAARVASAPPPDLRSSFRPTYNLAVNLASRFDRETADNVLRRSFAQWQAQRADLLTIQLSHRVAVLEDLGYLKDWSLTETGHRLSRIYHESDLLLAEALAADLLDGAEPSVLAGVVSAVVFEPRRRPSSRRTRRSGPPGGRPAQPAQRTSGGSAGRETGGRARMALRRSRARGGADPLGRRAPSRAPYPAALVRPGHRCGVLGPWSLLRDGPGRGRPRRGGPGPGRLRAHREVRGRPGAAGGARRHRSRHGHLGPASRRHAPAGRGGGRAADALRSAGRAGPLDHGPGVGHIRGVAYPPPMPRLSPMVCRACSRT